MKAFLKKRGAAELRVFIKYCTFTAFSTVCGLALYYFLLRHLGMWGFSVHGRDIAFEMTAGRAYIVYYITGVVLLYLLKWFHADGVRARSFAPRLLGYCVLYAISMTVGNLLLGVFTNRFGIDPAFGLWLTAPVTFVINFLGNRVIIFCDSDSRESKKYIEMQGDETGNGGEKECQQDDSAE